jgi:hypothetical protein
MGKTSKELRERAHHCKVTKWVNGLTSAQLTKLYDVIDGPVPVEFSGMTDEEVLAELRG